MTDSLILRGLQNIHEALTKIKKSIHLTLE